MLRTSVRQLVAAILVLLCITNARVGAAQAVRGAVLGTVTDKTGAVLPGATINVTNTGTSVIQATVADSQGRYSVADLLPGTYDVEASLSGFQKVVRPAIRLVVGSQILVDFSLGPSSVAETITVTAAAPIVDTVSAALGR